MGPLGHSISKCICRIRAWKAMGSYQGCVRWLGTIMAGDGDEHPSVHRRYKESELGSFIDSRFLSKSDSQCNPYINRYMTYSHELFVTLQKSRCIGISRWQF